MKFESEDDEILRPMVPVYLSNVISDNCQTRIFHNSLGTRKLAPLQYRFGPQYVTPVGYQGLPVDGALASG